MGYTKSGMPIGKQAVRDGVINIFLYVVGILAALVIVTIIRPQSDKPFVYEMGKNCALIAFMIVLFQVILAARFKFVSRPFGLDMIFRFHKIAAFMALGLFLLHPTLMASSEAGWRLILGLDVSILVWLGRLTLLTLILNVVLSKWRGSLNIEFQTWRWMHNVLGLTILGVGFSHNYFIGSDLQNPVMRVVWPAMFLIFAGAYLYHMVLRPWRLKSRQFVVTGVDRASRDSWMISLDAPEGKGRYEFEPGQFHFINFYRGGMATEEHHWTISWTPTRPGTMSTIKESHDFTSTIGKTKVGDRATVLGAYGRFSHTLFPQERDVVFIAGGIGITPFLGMLRYMHDRGDDRNVLLLWSNKRVDDIICREELEKIVKSGKPRLKIVHWLTDKDAAPRDWAGQKGRMDRESLAKYLGEGQVKRSFWLCAPPSMAENVLKILKGMGVESGRIHYERFEL